MYCPVELHMSIYVHLSQGYNPAELRVVLSWTTMGSTRRGWTEARSKIVLLNIFRGYNIVFLQEVQWVERGTEEHLTAPAEKLQGEDDDDTDTVTGTLKSAVESWTTLSEYSKR